MLSLLFGLFFASQNAAQSPSRRTDTRAWYQAYADGTRAIQQGKWQEAIDSLEASKRAGAPKPGRKVPSYGDNFIDFIPDYYLGIAYSNLKQYVQADRAFAAVRASGLIGPRDREYAEFNKQATVASTEVNRAPTVANATPPPGAGTTVAANPPAAVPPSPIQQTPPPSNGATTPVVQQPSVPIASQPAASLPIQFPGGARPGQNSLGNVTYRPSANVVAARPLNERAAISAYLSGQYDQASSLLGGAVTANAGTPRAYFYLACSRTALAILGQADASAVADAKAVLARAGDPAQFAADRRYISPRILQMLGLNP